MRPQPLPPNALPACLLLLTCTLLAPAAASAANVNVIVGNNLSFSPSMVNITAGDTVTWNNSGGIGHNVRADDGSFRCANGCDGQGGNGNVATNAWSFTLPFNTAGTYRYYCEAHGGPNGFGMSGVVNVAPAGGNDEPGTLHFGSATYNVNEGGGSATVTVVRSGGDDGAVGVSYATSNGSATAGNDYTTRTGTISFADNQDGTKSFTVPILDDSQVEGNETVNLTLSNPTGGASLGSPSSATLTIVDNDSAGSPGTLSFSAPSYSAGEAAGGATVTVRRTGGSSGAVSVHYATSDGSAVAGSDYTAASGTINFGGNDSADKTFNVGILDDNALEGNETVNLMLSAPTGGAALGAPSSATLTLLDDDVPVGPCVEGGDTLCLHGGRFLVKASFRPPGGQRQPANGIPFTERAGLFWFFNQNNIEMLIKVLNACVDPFNRWWVFYAATTNVEFEVVVADLQEQQVRVYGNDQGVPALPEQDTNAFATCP
jgi:plastocyanin